jgi:hypothetical protein
MLSFGRATVLGGTPLEATDQIIVQIADLKVTGHTPLHDIIGRNDVILSNSVNCLNLSEFGLRPDPIHLGF